MKKLNNRKRRSRRSGRRLKCNLPAQFARQLFTPEWLTGEDWQTELQQQQPQLSLHFRKHSTALYSGVVSAGAVTIDTSKFAAAILLPSPTSVILIIFRHIINYKRTNPPAHLFTSLFIFTVVYQLYSTNRSPTTNDPTSQGVISNGS